MNTSQANILAYEHNLLTLKENIQPTMSIQELMDEDSKGCNDNHICESRTQHVEKLQILIKSSILKTKTKVRKLSMQFLKTKRINSEKILRDNVQKMVELFEKASTKIIDTYFLLISNEKYLQFQSQNSIKDKLNFLKRQVNRGFLQTMKRVTKTKEDLQAEETEEIQQKKRLKAKNCKIPATSTVVLQKWLTQNFYCPYPSEKDRHSMAKDSGLDFVQVNNWFINKRQKIIRKYLKKDSQGIDDMKEDNSDPSEKDSGSSPQDELKEGSIE